jgi:predicted nucleic-acid-binding protein
MNKEIINIPLEKFIMDNIKNYNKFNDESEDFSIVLDSENNSVKVKIYFDDIY